MPRTLLENIQDVAIEIGEPMPSVVVTSNEPIVLQFYAFMNRVGETLVTDYDWQALAKEAELVTVGFNYSATMTTGSNILTMASTSGLTTDFQVTGNGIPDNTMITAVNPNVSVTLSNNATASQTVALDFLQVLYALPSDFSRLAHNTSYDVSNRWGLVPEASQGWAYMKREWATNSSLVRFRKIGGKLAIYPPQASGRKFTYEYQSKNYVTDNLGVTKARFTADTDTCIFADALMVLGCKLKFWQKNGFESTILADDYGRELSKYKGQDNPSNDVSMGRAMGGLLPGFTVPDGRIGS